MGLAVWLLSEGAGGVLTGRAGPLTGAPGAALLYALLAVLVWPARQGRPAADPAAPGSAMAGGAATGGAAGGSVAAGSPLGARWSRLPWLLLRTSAGCLLLPGQVRGPGVLGSAIAGQADGEPGWLAGLAVISAAAIWVVAENLGEILTGTGTDPNTGPLLILLAAAYWPLSGPTAQLRRAAELPASARVDHPQTSVTTAG